MELFSDITRGVVVDSSIEGSRIAFAEVIGLRSLGETSHKLPVNLVKILGLEHNRGDNTLSRRSFHDDGDGAKEDIELRLDGRGFQTLIDGELCTICTVVKDAIGDVEGVRDDAGAIEVECMISDSKGRIYVEDRLVSR